MSALFNFHSFLTVVLLVICTCTYVKMHFPTILAQRTGFRGFFWKAARIGERLSPWVAAACFTMGLLVIPIFVNIITQGHIWFADGEESSWQKLHSHMNSFYPWEN